MPLRLSATRDQPSESGTNFHNWQEPLSKFESPCICSSSVHFFASRNLPLRLSCSRDQPSASGTSFHNWQDPLSKSDPGLRLRVSLQNLASRNLPPPCCAEAGRQKTTKAADPSSTRIRRPTGPVRLGAAIVVRQPMSFAVAALPRWLKKRPRRVTTPSKPSTRPQPENTSRCRRWVNHVVSSVRKSLPLFIQLRTVIAQSRPAVSAAAKLRLSGVGLGGRPSGMNDPRRFRGHVAAIIAANLC